MSIEDEVDQAKARIALNLAAVKLLESGQVNIGSRTQSRIDELRRKIAEDQAIVDRGNDAP